MTALWSLFAFVVAIGVLVTVHEWGHYRMARAVGVRVLRFSIGFGRPLRTWTGRDGTEFVLAGIPLGGFVRMLDERDGPVGSADLAGAFNRKPVWARALVISAGPAANFAFAVLAFWLMLLIGVPGLRPWLDAPPTGTPAAAAGIAAEDEIVAVAGRPTPTWEAASLGLLDEVLAGASSVELRLRDVTGSERAVRLSIDDPVALTAPGALPGGLGLRPWQPPLPPVLGDLSPDGAAARAGLRSGDEVLSLDGTPISDWRVLVEQVQERPGARVDLRIRRAGVAEAVSVDLDAVEEGGARTGRLGARVAVPAGLIERLRATQRLDPLAAVPAAAARTLDLSVLTVRMLWRMLTGEASLANISGPINIAQYAGVTASIGPVAFLGFLAVISVSLGVLNLLPIPVLDGGHLAFLAAEAVKGSPVTARTEALAQQVGLLLLFLLMGFAFYNDIARLLA